MSKQTCLNDIKPGQYGVVTALRSGNSMRRRLLDIGLIENTVVECLGRSPGGDPSAFLIRGAVIAIRAADGDGVLVRVS
ncbi:MAG: FeoA family protein [Bacillota bacterium]|nr:FeoA family protein [Bacillota bacterium]